MADTHTYKFNVSMSCSGCSGAVDRVLKKLEGKQAGPDPDSSPSAASRRLSISAPTLLCCTERWRTGGTVAGLHAGTGTDS